MKTIERGGWDKERLYLRNAEFTVTDGTRIIVKASNFPDMDMTDVVARHVARYGIIALFCRPGYRVLDFPCGSGYGAEFLRPFGIKYLGMDFDKPTVEYARRVYGDHGTEYKMSDLRKPHLPKKIFDVVCCIEGLEHIEGTHQPGIVKAFAQSLKPSGTLIISSPQSRRSVSGPNPNNPHHLHELTRWDFLKLLTDQFGQSHVEMITQIATMSTGKKATMLFGICHL
ncbi:MAG TPA: class I SAM-dependent methyltransferase [Candidatus Paceibacterota bacterium]|nr:class I SAM-dependent methyltransferase [Candidatus Paceibacterota bacterium]